MTGHKPWCECEGCTKPTPEPEFDLSMFTPTQQEKLKNLKIAVLNGFYSDWFDEVDRRVKAPTENPNAV